MKVQEIFNEVDINHPTSFEKIAAELELYVEASIEGEVVISKKADSLLANILRLIYLHYGVGQDETHHIYSDGYNNMAWLL